MWGYASKFAAVGKRIADFLQDPDEAISAAAAIDRAGQWEGDFAARRWAIEILVVGLRGVAGMVSKTL
jgi:hypothetical protein